MLEEDSFGVPPRRTPSLASRRRTPSLSQAPDPTGSPQTIVSDTKPDDRRTISPPEYRTGVAQTAGDGRTASPRNFSTGFARTTDDRRTSSPRKYSTDIARTTDDGRTTSPRNFSTGISQTIDEGRASSHRDYGAGIAETTGDSRRSSRGDYVAGIAQSTDDEYDDENDDGDATASEAEPLEPVLHEAQVDLQPLSITAQVIAAEINEKRGFEPSVTSASSVSQDAKSSGASSTSKMPEFFGHAVFQTVLHNPTIAHQLLNFAQSRLCGENMEFLARVNKYHALLNEVSKAIFEIHKDFISNSAPSQINLTEHHFLRVNSEMKTSLTSTLPALESIFVNAQLDIERLVYTDVYPKFVRHQMSVSAAKALGGDRSKYGGLGDCFVLTDPAKADNPIVYATDGFVKVTGYSRNEIIPRNCRFLQCRQTDQSAVRRLKASIDKREEYVELLLNQKKNGEPFWNLLYTTPLFDRNGKLVFFLGGQINCSTTVNRESDVLRILAQSKDTDEDAASRVMSPQLVKPPRSRSILNAFRTNSRSNIQPRAPGMENSLLDTLEDKDLKSQMNTFYNAYSNVCRSSTPFLDAAALHTAIRSRADYSLVHHHQL